jgi:hypothetical protein
MTSVENALTVSGWDLPDFVMCPSQIDLILAAHFPSQMPCDADEMEDQGGEEEEEASGWANGEQDLCGNDELSLSLPADSDSEDLSGDRAPFPSSFFWTSANGHDSGCDKADSACSTPSFTPLSTSCSSSSSRSPALDAPDVRASEARLLDSDSTDMDQRSAPLARPSSSRTKSKCSIAARQRKQAEALKAWVETENDGRPFASAEEKEMLAARLAMSVSQVRPPPPCGGSKHLPDVCQSPVPDALGAVGPVATNKEADTRLSLSRR